MLGRFECMKSFCRDGIREDIFFKWMVIEMVIEKAWTRGKYDER